MDKKAALLDFVKNELLHGRREDLGPGEDLLSSGVIDSLGILRLVSFIEERFGIEVPDEDVVYENFQTVQTLADYLDSR